MTNSLLSLLQPTSASLPAFLPNQLSLSGAPPSSPTPSLSLAAPDALFPAPVTSKETEGYMEIYQATWHPNSLSEQGITFTERTLERLNATMCRSKLGC